jgi:hypothetical protein
MLVISAGMQKSGSGYIYNVINDLLVTSGHKDARTIKDKYGFHEIMKWHNNNIGKLDFNILLKLLFSSLKEGKFAVKTHEGPSRYHNILLKLRLIKTIYIYRDPRDVLLSVQDHGRKIRDAGENHTFANLVEFDDAYKEIKSWINIFDAYLKLKDVLILRYEDLLTNPVLTVETICKYIDIHVSPEDINKILLKYDKNNEDADLRGLHFNKAIIYRYKNELSQARKDFFKNDIGEVIQKMGYEI